MAPPAGSKGAFRADISDDAVEAALRAVEERTSGRAPDEDGEGTLIELDADAGEAEGGAETAASPEAVAASGADAGALGEEASEAPDPEAGEAPDPLVRLEALEAALQEKERLLEDSLQRGREMMERLQEAADRLARQAADFENYRKRAQREREEVQRFGIEKLLRDLIPVLDNFDRALDHAGVGADIEGFAQGVAMTRKLFEETLGRFGVKAFTAVGQPFDPKVHEAMDQVQSTEHPANVVAREMVRGYLLHDRLVRPAMVSVSTGPGPATDAADATETPASAEQAEAVAAADPSGGPDDDSNNPPAGARGSE